MEQTQGIRNDEFETALLNFYAVKNTDNQNNLIKAIGKGKFLLPVIIDGNVENGFLERNSEIKIKIMADKDNNLFYSIFTDWDALCKFSKAKEDAIVVTYEDIREILKIDKADITGVVINPSIYEKDFIMTNKIMEDIDKRLEELKVDYKAVIFDLDGTLADSIESIAYSANRAIEAFGFKAIEVEKFKKFAGDGADILLKRCLIEAGDSELKNYDNVMEKYKELFKKDYLYNVKPYDGIVKLLNDLKERGIKIAVLSNKPQDRAIDVVNDLFGEGFFDIVLGHCDGREKKPAPDGAIIIAEKLGIKAEECIYVGDTDTDMKTGKNAGMLTVGVIWGFRDRLELFDNGADKIIDEPDEILNIII